ncbi:MAG: peptidoglycan-binding domain-containing protein, partial [Clostridiales Family XIII bacterium]|nr:peptidoglycan-binding protein [Clostridia bacterium]MDY3013383.1 peptidoglycan-binding domain-containing protein [Clostridiales Family XIII bacterium]
GIISFQPAGNKKYLANCYEVSWKFYNSGYDAGSALIKAIQRFLKEQGYYTGKIDGWCGKQTVIAMQKFLRAKGYYAGDIDGSMGPKTVKGWQRYINSRL